MMLNAQKMIEERKKALSIPSSGTQKNNSKDKKPTITTDFEKQAKIAQLQVIFYLQLFVVYTRAYFVNFISYVIYFYYAENNDEVRFWLGLTFKVISASP